MKTETQKVRVLLVENDEEDVAILRRHVGQVKGQQITVVCAATAEDAMSLLSTEPFDFVFLDLNLGEGTVGGIDLLNSLQENKVDIPAIVVTGSGDELRAVEAMKSGAYDYLVKDNLTADLLERTMRNARQRHLLQQERAHMVEKLRELSVTDELTGLANRRSLDRKLEEEVRRSERTSHVFSALMIDLDHFKQVNDRYGHQTGDDVLKQCAAALRENVRAADFVARYGGEEFCVLLPVTPPKGGHRLAEKLRKAVKDLPDPVPTISIGVAFWQPHMTAEEVLRRADEALYKAKAAGRDRVVLYGR